jgi:hypothetical protein
MNKEELKVIIEEILEEFKGKNYDGQTFPDNFEVKFRNVEAVAEIHIHKNLERLLLYFNIKKINKKIKKLNVNPRTFIKYLILHEFSHLWIYREKSLQYNEAHNLLLQMLDVSYLETDFLRKTFSKYSVLTPILIEVLCDSMTYDMCYKWLNEEEIKDTEIIISNYKKHYDKNIINIIGGKGKNK